MKGHWFLHMGQGHLGPSRAKAPCEGPSAHGIAEVEAAMAERDLGCHPARSWDTDRLGPCPGRAGHADEAAASHPGAGRRQREVGSVAAWRAWRPLLPDL